jgi:hypothetical protein
MNDLNDMFGIDEMDGSHEDAIRELHIAVDQDGEFFDDPRTRVAFLRVALNQVIGEGAEFRTDYAERPFTDLGNKTPFETVINDGPEGLKAVLSHLVTHYRM